MIYTQKMHNKYGFLNHTMKRINKQSFVISALGDKQVSYSTQIRSFASLGGVRAPPQTVVRSYLTSPKHEV